MQGHMLSVWGVFSLFLAVAGSRNGTSAKVPAIEKLPVPWQDISANLRKTAEQNTHLNHTTDKLRVSLQPRAQMSKGTAHDQLKLANDLKVISKGVASFKAGEEKFAKLTAKDAGSAGVHLPNAHGHHAKHFHASKAPPTAASKVATSSDPMAAVHHATAELRHDGEKTLPTNLKTKMSAHNVTFPLVASSRNGLARLDTDLGGRMASPPQKQDNHTRDALHHSTSKKKHAKKHNSSVVAVAPHSAAVTPSEDPMSQLHRETSTALHRSDSKHPFTPKKQKAAAVRAAKEEGLAKLDEDLGSAQPKKVFLPHRATPVQHTQVDAPHHDDAPEKPQHASVSTASADASPASSASTDPIALVHHQVEVVKNQVTRKSASEEAFAKVQKARLGKSAPHQESHGSGLDRLDTDLGGSDTPVPTAGVNHTMQEASKQKHVVHGKHKNDHKTPKNAEVVSLPSGEASKDPMEALHESMSKKEPAAPSSKRSSTSNGHPAPVAKGLLKLRREVLTRA